MKRALFLTLLLSGPVVFAQDAALEPVGAGILRFEATDYKAVEGKPRSIKVIRTDGSRGEVSVTFETVEGSAKAGRDFDAVSEVLTFQDGETEKTVAVAVKNDLAFELRSQRNHPVHTLLRRIYHENQS